MAHGDNATLARRLLIEVWGEGDLSVLPELVSADITAHVAAVGRPLHGIASYRELVAVYHGMYGQTRFSIDDQLEDGDRVATRWTAHLVEGQSMLPELATGDRDVMGMSIAAVSDGRISACWDTWDSLAALQSGDGADLMQRLSFTV